MADDVSTSPAVATPDINTPAPDESISDYAKRYAASMEPTDEDSSSTDEGETTAEAETSTEEDSSEDDVEKPLPKIETLQKLARDGKYQEVLEALGIEVDGTKVPSDRFAKFRKLQKQERAKLEQRAQQLSAFESKVHAEIAEVKKHFEPFAKARKALDDGDIVGALELAFGESFDAISEKAVSQKLSTDPEVAKLKRKLEAKEKAEKEAQEKAQREAQEKAQAQAQAQYTAKVAEALKGSDDPTLAKLGTHPDFPAQVFRIMLRAYQTNGVELDVEEAAKQHLKELRRYHDEWSTYLTPGGSKSSVHTDEAGTSPLITDRAGTSPENKRKAPKGVPLTRAKAAPTKSISDLPEDEQWEALKAQFLRESKRDQLAR